jgi:hypothetical protein
MFLFAAHLRFGRDYIASMREWLLNMEHLAEWEQSREPTYSEENSASAILTTTNPYDLTIRIHIIGTDRKRVA